MRTWKSPEEMRGPKRSKFQAASKVCVGICPCRGDYLLSRNCDIQRGPPVGDHDFNRLKTGKICSGIFWKGDMHDFVRHGVLNNGDCGADYEEPRQRELLAGGGEAVRSGEQGLHTRMRECDRSNKFLAALAEN